MKEVLELIEQKNKEFAQLPFFQFLRDKSIHPRQRLVWVPCVIPLIMSVKDLNNCILRNEPTTDPIQKIINFHSYEDGRHWRWFLTDLERLDLDSPLKLSDTLRFLWGEETQTARLLAYNLVASTLNASPAIKLVAIETVEATGIVAFSAFAEVGQELEKITQKRNRYFSASHLAVETGHVFGEIDNMEQLLENVQLTEDEKVKAICIVETVYNTFSQLVNNLMKYAHNHYFEQPFCKTSSLEESLVNK
ncbi:MAG: hypothetical protein KI793_10445 [Rivularia sp. (in: Bacteria)]|nr:hypothetical protein [Rivularia sp. MS3]